MRGGDFGEDLFPFGVGIDLVVELLQAQAQVVEQLLLGMNGEVFISLVLQLLDERLFEFGFALVGGVAEFHLFPLRYDGAVVLFGYDAVVGHLCESQEFLAIILVLFLTQFALLLQVGEEGLEEVEGADDGALLV